MKYIYMLLILLAALLFVKSVRAAEYTLPRCYYPATGRRYIPTQIKQLSTGVGCYVNVAGKLKSMGVATMEDWTGLYNNGDKVYENDRIYYAPTNEMLTVTKVNNDLWGTGWCLMPNATSCYPLYNNYGRTLISTGIVQ